MNNTVISVEHLTKQYDLGVIGTGTLARDIERWWARVRGKPDPYSLVGHEESIRKYGESILALDDISFTVEQGAALGIIGKNGAGKSTLLKILSRVTSPTSGIVKVKGRIGSLLEVGTGFHAELTGRENIFLNGAILGMRKEEVERKFDEIVDFSGVEKFIDTPVKRYSSGMYVRLAFAVAAHLDPDILIVDEVLAVGDAEFQKKCLGKMGDVRGEGRTVLFVSHNMRAIQKLCSRAIWVDEGVIHKVGITDEIIEEYLSLSDKSIKPEIALHNHPGRSKDSVQIFTDVRLLNQGILTDEFQTGGPLSLEVKIHIGPNQLKNADFGFDIKDRSDRILFATNMSQYHYCVPITHEDDYKINATIPYLNLTPGYYSISLYVGDESGDIDIVNDAIGFEVRWNNEKILAPHQRWGPLFMPVSWESNDE